jgi:hypothetical protein
MHWRRFLKNESLSAKVIGLLYTMALKLEYHMLSKIRESYCSEMRGQIYIYTGYRWTCIPKFA